MGFNMLIFVIRLSDLLKINLDEVLADYRSLRSMAGKYLSGINDPKNQYLDDLFDAQGLFKCLRSNDGFSTALERHIIDAASHKDVFRKFGFDYGGEIVGSFFNGILKTLPEYDPMQNTPAAYFRPEIVFSHVIPAFKKVLDDIKEGNPLIDVFDDSVLESYDVEEIRLTLNEILEYLKDINDPVVIFHTYD